MSLRQQMNIVVAGHVDHGKSTVIGRLLADTGSLPEGKLEQVKAHCRKTSRVFEYAFLLDALKAEQAQGITIDTARCFFKTEKRDYIIIDAPGHLEFLKNMVSGASRAEAALLVIDVHEGVQENSKRHGFMLSMLGIRQIVVLVNKMDLVKNDLKAFERVRAEYAAFLEGLKIVPAGFVPISAQTGDNIVSKASWYQGKTVLDYIDGFSSSVTPSSRPSRFPVQDIYKFTADGDERRILAGTIESGSLSIRDRVQFFPSKSESTISGIEIFSAPTPKTVTAGQATGFTLTDELFVKPGDIMVKKGDATPYVGTRFKANLFWMGRSPMLKDKRYKLKLTTTRAQVQLSEVVRVLDATDLGVEANKTQLDRYDVAECILETSKPIAFDLAAEFESTGRFVIVDHYEIAGGGIIQAAIDDGRSSLHDQVKRREIGWDAGSVSESERVARNGHRSKFVLFVGTDGEAVKNLARSLERKLYKDNLHAYYLGLSNVDRGLDSDVVDAFDQKVERVRRLGELARLFTDSGMIFISALSDIDAYDIETLKTLNSPKDIVVIEVGQSDLSPALFDLSLPEKALLSDSLGRLATLLREKDIVPDYCI